MCRRVDESHRLGVRVATTMDRCVACICAHPRRRLLSRDVALAVTLAVVPATDRIGVRRRRQRRPLRRAYRCRQRTLADIGAPAAAAEPPVEKARYTVPVHSTARC